jgi:hypothetical protein
MRVLTSGVDSEYVLAQLCGYLRQNRWDVTELDFGSFKGDPRNLIGNFKGEDTVYITSAHTNLTLRVAEVIAPKMPDLYPNYLSPLEIIRAVNPALSIYIPHDLLTPYGDTNLNEFRFLDLFDYVLAPTASPALQAALGLETKVVDAGWIKHANLNISSPRIRTAANDRPKVALFVSMLEHLRWRYGIEGVASYFAPLLKANVRIKLPAWSGVDKIEVALQEAGEAEVVPSQENSINLILESDIIVCNGASSIHAEAVLMGRPAICLLDDNGVSTAEQRSKLRDFPNIYFHDYRRRQDLSDSLLESLIATNEGLAPIKPFDFAIIERIIASSIPNFGSR